MKRDNRLMIISGEVSGDNLGAELMHYLRKLGYNDFFGIGGDAMASHGCRMIVPSRELMVFGILQAITSYIRLKRVFRKIEKTVQREKPVAAILIDSPGFNLRVMKRLKGKIPFIVQMVCPQFWATRFYRARVLQNNVSLLLTLFSFEKELCQKLGIPCVWIGHPLIQKIPRSLKSLGISPPLSIEPTIPKPLLPRDLALGRKYRIALFPGSRSGEIQRILPRLLQGALAIKKRTPSTEFFLSVSSPELMPQVNDCLKSVPELSVQIMTKPNHHLQMMVDCDMLITTSGTICLEAATFLKPMIAVYFLRWFDFFITAFLLRSRFFCMVNIIAGKRVVMEFIQTEITAENLLKEVIKIRKNEKSYCQNMISELANVKRKLGSGDPGKKAAASIEELIRGRNSCA